MKIKLMFFFLTFLSIGYAQDRIIQSVDSTKNKFIVNAKILDENGIRIDSTEVFYRNIDNQDALKNAITSNYLFDNYYSIKKRKGKYIIDVRKNRLFNEAMLNVMFAEEISSYIGESKDLSLKKSYAVINTADKTLFLGRSYIFGRKKDIDKLTHIFTAGVKAKLNEEFASFLSSDRNLQNEIGVNLKYTWIGRGIINYGDNVNKLKNLKEKVAVPNKIEAIEANIKKDSYNSELKEIENIHGKDSKEYKKKVKDIYSDAYEKSYLELAQKEIELIRREKLYHHIWDHYITTEAFIPVSRKFNSILPTETASSTLEEPFYPWRLNTGYTSFWKFSSGEVIYLSGFGSVYNNNNIETGIIKSKTLETPNANNPNLIDKSTSVFIGEYDRFTSGSIKAEFVSYIFNKGTFGVSASVEQVIGNEFNTRNWKLGVPVSLKDKEGKPTVNFELQWREFNKEHFLGIGVGLAFGKFIK